MIRIQHRLVVDSTLFGLMLTLLVVAADSFGLLVTLERWFYDQRAARCQYFLPAPTDKLVHLDIDDAALARESVGGWPWPRSKVAQILDETRLAEPKAVALDVLFSEPQDPEYRPGPNGTFASVDHDEALAAALKRLGTTLVPASMPFRTQQASPVYLAAREELTGNPELTQPQVVERLRRRGFTGDDLAPRVHDEFITARQAAMYARIDLELRASDLSADRLRARILPDAEPTLGPLGSPVVRVFQSQLQNVLAARALAKFSRPIPAGAPPLFSASVQTAPILPLIRGAGSSGFVDYPESADGKVRSVPLFVECGGRMYPQLGLALACAALGVDPADFRFDANRITIPRPGGGDLVVPVRTLRPQGLIQIDREIPAVMDIPWFGPERWKEMYDAGSPGSGKHHLPIGAVWEACDIRHKMAANNVNIDKALENVLRDFDQAKATAFFANPPDPADWDARAKLVEYALGELEPIIKAYAEIENPEPQERKEKEFFDRAGAALRTARAENEQLKSDLQRQRDFLRARLGGRAVLIGWIATGVAADFVPTSIHPKCPGVVLHGAIFNGLMTGELWRTLPQWVAVLVTVALGLLTTAAVSFLSPGKALASALLLLGGYLGFNGLVLFDKYNLVLGAAGPVVAVASVWSGGTLAKLVIERWERARIERKFRSYVDPRIVDYFKKHPEQAHFEGERREMTVVFTDLAGFTKLTESMGEATVPLLNELWAAMVPVIRRNEGIVAKFLGDGIMFFYGAPEASEHHARDAVATVLAMHKALAEFNERMKASGRPTLALRFGVSTGWMLVGDAGGGEAMDYTVLGDAVNLGSRLESGGKAVGTKVLVSDQTVRQAGDEFLFRPIAELVVIGKRQGVMTYEALARADEATDEQKRLAEATRGIVDSYRDGRLKECLGAIGRMEAAFGAGKLTALYRERCEYFLQHPPPAEPFTPQISLTEK